MVDTSLALPQRLYPLFAPLPIPMVMHLVIQEYRSSRRKAASKRPTAEQVWMDVEERVRKARTLACEYMLPFVMADTKHREKGLPQTFPSPDWILDAIADYTPEGKRNALPTLDYWQKKGILLRDRPRGRFDVTRVAALLIARIADEEHQRNWLPSEIRDEEQQWWCYGQTAPNAPVQEISLPAPTTLPAATLLWTPWLGIAWEEEWTVIGERAFRWAGVISSEHELEGWDRTLVTTIRNTRANALISQEAVQAALVQEASRLILQQQAQQHQIALSDIVTALH